MGIGGYLMAAVDQHAVGILLASALIGGLYLIFHSTMQAWATDIAPEVRGPRRLFRHQKRSREGRSERGSGRFLAPQQQQYGRLCSLIAATLSVPVVITAALTRARYPGTALATLVEEVARS